jgi:hypothetical protein
MEVLAGRAAVRVEVQVVAQKLVDHQLQVKVTLVEILLHIHKMQMLMLLAVAVVQVVRVPMALKLLLIHLVRVVREVILIHLGQPQLQLA